MMKNFSFILALSFLLSTVSFADDQVNPVTRDVPPKNASKAMTQNELSMLDALIGATEQNLKTQKELRSQIEEYQQLQDRYLADTENTELLFKAAKSASGVYSRIEKGRLSQAFNPEFMKELKLFAQVAMKRGVPKAR